MDGTYTVDGSTRVLEKTIVVNQLRGFVAALYKFFWEGPACDGARVLAELKIIKTKIEGLMADISDRQYDLLFPEEDSTFDFSYDQNTSDFLRAMGDTSEERSWANSTQSTQSRSRSRNPGFGATFSAHQDRDTSDFLTSMEFSLEEPSWAHNTQSRSRSRNPGFGATFSRSTSCSANSRSAKSTTSRPKSATNRTFLESSNAGRSFQDHRSTVGSEEIEDMSGATGSSRRRRSRSIGEGLLDLS